MGDFLLKVNESFSGPIDLLHAKGTSISTAQGLTFDEQNTLHCKRLEAETIITKSDLQFKENIENIEEALKKIIQLKGKTYNYVYDDKQTQHNGFIAQEVQTVVPNVVLKDDYGNLYVNYIELIPLITDSIQELNNKVEVLNTQISKFLPI